MAMTDEQKRVLALAEARRRQAADQSRQAAPGAMDYASGFTGGFNRGLVGMAGLPVDLVSAGLGLVGAPISDRPVGGSAWLRENLPEAMFPEAPDTTGGRILARTGEELGASVLPAAGIMGAASRAGAQAIGPAQNAAQAFLDPIRRSPLRATLGEAAAATGAGVGAGVAQEMVPDSPIAEMTGQIVGGFAPTALANMPASLVARGANAIRSRVSETARRDVAREAARDYLGEMTAQQVENMNASEGIARQIPGFNPTLAERSGSPGLIAKQADIESKMTGQDLDAAVARRVTDREAIERFAEGAAPKAAVGPDVVVDMARNRVENLRQGVDAQSGAIDAQRRTLAEGIPQANVAEEGARLRGLLQDRIGEEQAGFKLVAREYGLDDPEFVVPFTDFRQELADAYRGASSLRTKTGERATVPPAIVRDIENADDLQNFPALMEIRSDITDAIRRAERQPSVDDVQLRGLRAMKAQFDTALERAVRRTGDPEIAQRYADFRQSYLTRFIEPLKQRASYDVLHRDPQGAYITPDERVVQAYFQKGNPTAAQQFNTVFGGDPEATSALESVAYDSLRRAAVRDGVIDQRALNNWLRDHESVLASFPQIRDRVQNIAQAESTLANRQRQLVQRKRAVDDAILTREISAVDRDVRSADEAVARALESPRKMASLFSSVRKSQDARSALQRAVWNNLSEMPAGRLGEYLQANRATLKYAGITDKQIDALRVIDGARLISSRVPIPRGSAAIPDSSAAFLKTFGVRPEMLSNRLNALNTGRADRSWLITNLLTNALTRKQSQFDAEIWREILYDPEAARDLYNSLMTGKLGGEQAKRLQARLFALGITASDTTRAESGEQDSAQ